MGRKGVLPATLLFFGMLIAAFIIVIILFMFFTGFLEEGTKWITTTVSKTLENIWRAIPIVGNVRV